MVSGCVGGLEPRSFHGPCLARPSPLSPLPPSPAYLIGVVKELQHREDAGANEQPHLAPNVTCRGAQGGQ